MQVGFKAKVVLAVARGDKTLAELAEQFDGHPNQITEWKQLLKRTAEVFGRPRGTGGAGPEGPPPQDWAVHAGE